MIPKPLRLPYFRIAMSSSLIPLQVVSSSGPHSYPTNGDNFLNSHIRSPRS